MKKYLSKWPNWRWTFATWVVGFDLAGGKAVYLPKTHVDVFTTSSAITYKLTGPRRRGLRGKVDLASH